MKKIGPSVYALQVSKKNGKEAFDDNSQIMTIGLTKEIGITSGHPALDKVKPLMISTAEDYLKQMKLLE